MNLTTTSSLVPVVFKEEEVKVKADSGWFGGIIGTVKAVDDIIVSYIYDSKVFDNPKNYDKFDKEAAKGILLVGIWTNRDDIKLKYIFYVEKFQSLLKSSLEANILAYDVTLKDLRATELGHWDAKYYNDVFVKPKDEIARQKVLQPEADADILKLEESLSFNRHSVIEGLTGLSRKQLMDSLKQPTLEDLPLFSN